MHFMGTLQAIDAASCQCQGDSLEVTAIGSAQLPLIPGEVGRETSSFERNRIGRTVWSQEGHNGLALLTQLMERAGKRNV